MLIFEVCGDFFFVGVWLEDVVVKIVVVYVVVEVVVEMVRWMFVFVEIESEWDVVLVDIVFFVVVVVEEFFWLLVE